MTSPEEHLDISELRARLEPELPRLRSSIRSRVHSAISNSTTGELLTLKLRGSARTISPAPTPEYVRYLVDYLKGKGAVESAAVEGVALRAAEAAIEEFYTSEATITVLGDEVVRQLGVNQQLRAALVQQVGAEAKWLSKEVSDKAGGYAKAESGRRMMDAATHAVGSAMHTAGGQVVAGLAAKALALPVVKAALVKAIIAAAHSVAFQKIVL